MDVKSCGKQGPHAEHEWRLASTTAVVDLLALTSDDVYPTKTPYRVFRCRGRRAGGPPMYRVTIIIEPEPGLDLAPEQGKAYRASQRLEPEWLERDLPELCEQSAIGVGLDRLARHAAHDYFELMYRDWCARTSIAYRDEPERRHRIMERLRALDPGGR